jgi:hypothetical protein
MEHECKQLYISVPIGNLQRKIKLALLLIFNKQNLTVNKNIQNHNSACCFVWVCEILSLTLREEHGLRVFENRALRRISGPKRNEVTGEWRTFHNEELHMLYSSPNIKQIKPRRMT